MAKILVLEDDAELAMELSALLSEQGHDVDWQRMAGEARNALDRHRYDLLICDIYIYRDGKIIPDGGLALIGWIRTAAYTPDCAWMKGLPIIAISGATRLPGNEHILNIAKTIGADHTIAKPFNETALLRIVEEALGENVTG